MARFSHSLHRAPVAIVRGFGPALAPDFALIAFGVSIGASWIGGFLHETSIPVG